MIMSERDRHPSMPSAAAGIPLPEIKQLLRDIGRWYLPYNIFSRILLFTSVWGKSCTILGMGKFRQPMRINVISRENVFLTDSK